MQLPDSLKPWHEWLSWFPPELAISLGSILQKINPHMGQFRSRARGGEAFPEGLGNLHRRGPYERLLGSEWLLAEEMPDEFLRRAAAKEQLFLAPQPREKETNRRIIALFDAGPMQLGAPRLVHLALWILLCRRASLAGAELQCGLLQEASPRLFPAQNPLDLLGMLKWRSYVQATLQHWSSWQSCFDEQDIQASECWIIGSQLSNSNLRGSTHRIRIARSLNDDALELDLQLSGKQHLVTLALPGIDAGSALLRGNFLKPGNDIVQQKKTQPRFAITHSPVFSDNGNWLLIPKLDHTGTLAIRIPIKSGQKDIQMQHQQWKTDGEVLALFRNGRSTGALLAQDGMLRFWQMSHFVAQKRPAQEQFRITPGRGSYQPAAWLREGKHELLFVLDQAGHLIQWSHTQGKALSTDSCNLTDCGVLALVQPGPNRIIYAKQNGQNLSLVYRGTTLLAEYPLGRIPLQAKVLVEGNHPELTPVLHCAVQIKSGQAETWCIFAFSAKGPGEIRTHEIQLPPGWHAIGLYREQEGKAALLILGPQRNALALVNERKTVALHMTASPICRHTFCPGRGYLAMLTLDRELIVYALAERSVVLHIQGNHDAAN